MKNILIIGGGAMGSAFAIPCVENRNKVTITEPYNLNIINNLSKSKKIHPTLKIKLPKKILFKKYSSNLLNKKYDLIVVALSSEGINFIAKELSNKKLKSSILLLTKGLKYNKKKGKIFTLSEELLKYNKKINISVLKGPSLAGELSQKINTEVLIANKNINIAKDIGKMISTKYYKSEYSSDVIGVEVCSAIKNIYSMILGACNGLNMKAYIFKKSIVEMAYVIKKLNGDPKTVYSLAGIGDLYVSAMGGRNSKMGSYLGKGLKYKFTKKKYMSNVTIEAEQLVKEIYPFILKKFKKKHIPLMYNLIRSIIYNKKLQIN